MNEVKDIVVTLFLIFLCFLIQGMSGCEQDPLPGFEREPFIRISSDSSFKVYVENHLFHGDTLTYQANQIADFRLPFDMHSNTMHYYFFRNNGFLGKLTLNYDLRVFDNSHGSNKNFVLIFETLKLDSSSDFRNIFSYRHRNLAVRIDSLTNLAWTVNYHVDDLDGTKFKINF